MDTERLLKVHKRITGRRRRARAYQEHIEHTMYRKGMIGRLLGLSPPQVEELLQCLHGELKYVRKVKNDDGYTDN